MTTAIVKSILFFFVLLLLLPSSWGASTATETRLDALIPLTVGKSIPPGFTSIMSDGVVVVKITELPTVQDAHVNFLDPVGDMKDQLRYTIKAEEAIVTQATKGATTGYTILVVVTEDAAVRILDAENPVEQAKAEIAAKKIRYRAYGNVNLQLQIIKYIGPFIALFSKDFANVIPFFGGLI